MAAAIDTSRTHVATGSKVLRWALAAAAVFVLACGVAMVVQGGDATARLVGWVLAALGLLASVVALRWARKPLTEQVVLSPDGFRDVRVAPEIVPWAAVTGQTLWKMKNSTCVVLTLDPAAEGRLSLTRGARWSRTANALVGARGYVINTTDCSMSDTEMMALIEAFRARHGTAARSSG